MMSFALRVAVVSAALTCAASSFNGGVGRVANSVADPLLTMMTRDFLISEGGFDKKRMLQGGSFSALNSYLKTLKISLTQTFNTQQGLPGPLGNLKVQIKDVTCTNLSVQGIQFDPTKKSETEVDISFGASGIAMGCTFNWSYDYGGFLGSTTGNGSADVTFSGSSLTNTAALTFGSSSSIIPNNFKITSCNANFMVQSVNLKGGNVPAEVVDVFRNSLKQTIQDKFNTAVCNEINSLDGNVNSRLKMASKYYGSYVSSGGMNNGASSLQGSSSFNPPAGTTLVDFKNNTFVTSLLDLAKQQLGFSVGNGKSVPTGKVNSLLRTQILDRNGSYEVPLSNLTLPQGSMSMDGTSVSLSSLRIDGIDSVSNFVPLDIVGGQTFQSTIAFDMLTFHIGVNVDVKPGSYAGSGVNINSGSQGYLNEKTNVTFGLKNVTVMTTIYLAVDKNKLGSSVLSSSTDVSCAVMDVEVTKLSLTIGDINPPIISGLIDNGIDKIANKALKFAVQSFKGRILPLVPEIAQNQVRTQVNNYLQMSLQKQQQNCTGSSTSRSSTSTEDILSMSEQAPSPSNNNGNISPAGRFGIAFVIGLVVVGTVAGGVVLAWSKVGHKKTERQSSGENQQTEASVV